MKSIVLILTILVFGASCKAEEAAKIEVPVAEVNKIEEIKQTENTEENDLNEESLSEVDEIKIIEERTIKEPKKSTAPSITKEEPKPINKTTEIPVKVDDEINKEIQELETSQEEIGAIEKQVEEKLNSSSESVSINSIEEKVEIKSVDHSSWSALLQKYVSSSGDVNYAGMKAEKAKLTAYIDHLTSNAPGSDWSRNKTMVYWINMYNAVTVKVILDNYPVKSIMDLDGGKTWDVKRVTIGGQAYSLNDIEHNVLRSKYKDARIHFAVNCAAKSCPKLHNEAWTEANLETNLEKLTKEFVNNTKANQISKGKMTLSKIFEWYSSDFGNIQSFINRYSDTQVNSNAKVSYNEYDWSLNGH